MDQPIVDQPSTENPAPSKTVYLADISDWGDGPQGEARCARLCRIASNTAIGALLVTLLYLAHMGEKQAPTTEWRIAVGVNCVLLLACCLVPSLLRAFYHYRRGRSALTYRESVSWL